MRLSFILAGVLVLTVLGMISALHGPIAEFAWPPPPGAVIVGVLVFCSCFTGMMVVHLSVAHERAAHAATTLARTNGDLEWLIGERTQTLQEKVAELERARADAVEANAAKSRFLATMSHELRTPLNAILGFSELIQREFYGPAGDTRYVDYAQHIHQSGAHLLSLIGDILDLSKIEAGKMELHCEPLNVGDVVEQARQLAGQRNDCGLAIDVVVEDGLPALNADHRATVQMVLNLLSNAIKFTPPSGAIFVSARLLADGGVCINVRDTGVGIAQEDIPKALADYSQVRNLHVRPQQGTGLGLPIVNKLMEMHGGMLQLESEPGQGTSVSLLFPRERSLSRDESSLAA
jgi:two-component system, cell cycle sensor histidine kinase PleC